MNTVKRSLAIAAAVIASHAVVAPRYAVAQADDKAAGALATARRTYETAMQAARNDVDKVIGKKLDAATKPGNTDNKALDAARAEKLAFESGGAWPESPDTERVRARAAAAAQALLEAYGRAVAAYTKDGKESLAQAVTRERDEFESESDVVPWGQNVLKDKPEAERTLPLNGPELVVDTGLLEEYRVEVVGKRAGDAGTMVVGVPYTPGRRLVVSTTAGKDGAFRLLLSVRTSHVSADFGAQRPLDLSRTVAGEGLALRAQEGAIIVESVRIKPVIAGAPEAVAAKQKAEPGAKKKKEDPNDRYSSGKTWQGRDKNGGMSTIKLTRRSGDRVDFELPGSYAGSLWKVSGQLRGGVVSVDDMDRIRNPAGHPAVKVTGPGGTIRINSNGTLDFHASGRLSGGGRSNLVAEFDFSGAKPG